MKVCNDAEIACVFGVFMLGLPGQTEQDVRADIEFAKHLLGLAPGRMEIEVSILSLLPGTYFEENAQEWGLNIVDPEFLTGFTCERSFSRTEHLSRERTEELYDLFKSEVRKLSLQQTGRLSPTRLKECLITAAERHLLLLPVRHLCLHRHVDWIARMRSRKDHLFLSEIPEQDLRLTAPWQSIENSLTWCDDDGIVNERSPKAFVISRREAQYADYFRGKATFHEIARRIAGKRRTDEEVAYRECLDVYKKFEDNLAAIISL